MTQEFDDAVGRAREHLRRATLEGLEAAAALLEAASSVSGTGPATEGLSADLLRGIERVLHGLRSKGRFAFPDAVTGPLEEALAREIARWEMRSKSDPAARPVLRAFLGLRELLWELGMRTTQAASDPPGSTGSAKNAPPGDGPAKNSEEARPRKRRVQRFDVEE
mgnify:FL=1|jgi:hypothetical protein